MILKGWRYAAFVSVFVGSIGAALYPIVVEPMSNVPKYKNIQAVTRQNMDQATIQPGNMKVWTDPFDRKDS